MLLKSGLEHIQGWGIHNFSSASPNNIQSKPISHSVKIHSLLSYNCLSLSKLLLLLSWSLWLGTGRPQWGLLRGFSSTIWTALTVPDCPHRSGAPALWSSLGPPLDSLLKVPVLTLGVLEVDVVVHQGSHKSGGHWISFPFYFDFFFILLWFYFAVSIQPGGPHSCHSKGMAFTYYKPDRILEMAVLTCSRGSPSSHLPRHALFFQLRI